MVATHKGTVLSLGIIALLNVPANQTTVGGVNAVFYGDQKIITDTRLIAVEPSQKIRERRGTGLHMETKFETEIIVYVSGDGGVQSVQQEADEFTEAIEDLLNLNASNAGAGLGGDQLGGLITDGFVSSIDHGYRVPASQITRANRMIFSSRSRGPLF